MGNIAFHEHDIYHYTHNNKIRQCATGIPPESVDPKPDATCASNFLQDGCCEYVKKQDPPMQELLEPAWSVTLGLAIGVANILTSMVLQGGVLLQTIRTGAAYWKSIWSIMDSLFAGINFIISIMILANMNDYMSLRLLQAVAGMVIWFKALYYL